MMLVMMIEGGLSIVRTTRSYITLILQLPLTESDRGRVFTTQKFTDYFTHLSAITKCFLLQMLNISDTAISVIV